MRIKSPAGRLWRLQASPPATSWSNTCDSALDVFFQIQPDTDGHDLIAVIRDLPVTDVELDYRLPAPLYHQIGPALRKAGIPVTSLHNFCPLPLEFLDTGGSGDLFSLSDTRREERQEAVRDGLAHLASCFTDDNDPGTLRE